MSDKSGKIEKTALFEQLRTASELYVLMSVCTREPYVVCHPETFDDEILLFFDMEEAKAKAQSLVEEKIPVSIAKLEQKHLLVFYTNLYAMGVNALFVTREGEEYLVQLSEFVTRRDPKDLPEGKVWVENPALHLTAIYLMQELKGQPAEPGNAKVEELQEEIASHFGKGRYIVPVQAEDKGIPLMKLKTGAVFQPLFTDILEFQKFNRENKLKPMVIESAKIPEMLPKGAAGVIINPMGVHLPLSLNRKENQTEK